MKVFDVFVGNRKNNEIVHRKFIAKSADSIEIERWRDVVMDKLGFFDCLWATYGDGKSSESHAKDFKEYIRYYNKHKES